MKKFKNLSQIIAFLLLIIINLLLVFNTKELKALPQADYGEWGTSSGPSGELVTWKCYSSDIIECIVGETGKGFRP